MKPQVIFITGAMGVGKTTTASLLFQHLSNCAWLDGDSVWRINPFVVDERTIRLVESNIRFVLRNYVSAGYEYVLLSWVLHQQDIIDTLAAGLEGLDYDLHVFTLVCDEETLRSRWTNDPARDSISDLAFVRLRQSKELKTTKIDSTGKSPQAVVEEILAKLA